MAINVNNDMDLVSVKNIPPSVRVKRKLLDNISASTIESSIHMSPQKKLEECMFAFHSPEKGAIEEPLVTPPRKKTQACAKRIFSPRSPEMSRANSLLDIFSQVEVRGKKAKKAPVARGMEPFYQREPANYQWHVVSWNDISYDLASYAEGDKIYVFKIKKEQMPLFPDLCNEDIVAKRYRNPKVFLSSFAQEREMREILIKNGFKVTVVLGYDVLQNVVFERKIPYSCENLSNQWAGKNCKVIDLPLFTQKVLTDVRKLFLFAVIENKAVDFALRNMLYYSEESDIYLCDLNGEREHDVPDEVKIFLLSTLEELACGNREIHQFFIEPLQKLSPRLYHFFFRE